MCSCVLLQKLFCLVHLGGEVRTPAAVRMVQQHEGAVGLAHFLLGNAALAGDQLSAPRYFTTKKNNKRMAMGGEGICILERQNQRRLALVHSRLETALVEGLTERANAAARTPPSHEACPTLFIC